MPTGYVLECGVEGKALIAGTPRQAFSTTALGLRDWLLCAAVASSVLWLRELSKLLSRMFSRDIGPLRRHRGIVTRGLASRSPKRRRAQGSH